MRPLKHVYFLWVLLKLDLKEAGPVMQQQFHYENDEAIQHVVFMQHFEVSGSAWEAAFFFFKVRVVVSTKALPNLLSSPPAEN